MKKHVYHVKLAFVDDNTRKADLYVVASSMDNALVLAHATKQWEPEAIAKLMEIMAIEEEG